MFLNCEHNKVTRTIINYAGDNVARATGTLCDIYENFTRSEKKM